jgi:hypothetical protein
VVVLMAIDFLRTYSLWLVFAFLYMGTLHPEATDTQQELTPVFTAAQ